MTVQTGEQVERDPDAAGWWCPMCLRDVDAWEPGPDGRPNAQCPHCRSLERNRLLILALDRLEPIFATTTTLLDVAPTPGVDAALVRCVGEDRYVGFDLGIDQRDIKVLGDLTCMPFTDGSIDVLVAFHVLEHVPDDHLAMSEIRRVLGPTGIGLLQVPLKKGRPTDEDPSAPADERIRRFGRHDHVRQYGDDFEDRLRAAGLGVATFHAGHEMSKELLRRANTHGRFSLVTGVASDPQRPAEMIDALLARRRAAGFDESASMLPSAEARLLAGELRLMRRELETQSTAFRQMRRRAQRAEEALRLARGRPSTRVRATLVRSGRRARHTARRVRSVVRQPRRLVRRVGRLFG